MCDSSNLATHRHKLCSEVESFISGSELGHLRRVEVMEPNSSLPCSQKSFCHLILSRVPFSLFLPSSIEWSDVSQMHPWGYVMLCGRRLLWMEPSTYAIILHFSTLLHCIVQWVLQVMLLSACSFIVLVFTVFHYMVRPTWPSSGV
jgi:hypothetical protein